MDHSKKQVGFFGGTFDPIHFGHLNIAIHLKEFFRLDEILFSPAPCNPFKLDSPPGVDIEHRLQMTALGIEGESSFRLCSLEAEKKQVSYTVDVLEDLQQIYKDAKLFLLMSEEVARNFHRWKEVKKILTLAEVLIGTRKKDASELQFQKISSRPLLKIPTFEISSTEIRKRLKQKLYCAHLLPLKVLKYIEKHNLYQS